MSGSTDVTITITSSHRNNNADQLPVPLATAPPLNAYARPVVSKHEERHALGSAPAASKEEVQAFHVTTPNLKDTRKNTLAKIEGWLFWLTHFLTLLFVSVLIIFFVISTQEIASLNKTIGKGLLTGKDYIDRTEPFLISTIDFAIILNLFAIRLAKISSFSEEGELKIDINTFTKTKAFFIVLAILIHCLGLTAHIYGYIAHSTSNDEVNRIKAFVKEHGSALATPTYQAAVNWASSVRDTLAHYTEIYAIAFGIFLQIISWFIAGWDVSLEEKHRTKVIRGMATANTLLWGFILTYMALLLKNASHIFLSCYWVFGVFIFFVCNLETIKQHKWAFPCVILSRVFEILQIIFKKIGTYFEISMTGTTCGEKCKAITYGIFKGLKAMVIDIAVWIKKQTIQNIEMATQYPIFGVFVIALFITCIVTSVIWGIKPKWLMVFNEGLDEAKAIF